MVINEEEKKIDLDSAIILEFYQFVCQLAFGKHQETKQLWCLFQHMQRNRALAPV